MAWRKVSTSHATPVEISLSNFSTKQMLQEMINRKVMPEATAEAFAAIDENGKHLFSVDVAELEFARAELFSGRRAEALIHLERALGGDFIGRLATP